MNARKWFGMVLVAMLLVMAIAVCTASAQESREARLVRLDDVFRSSGVEEWLRCAGLSWSQIQYDARNIEEETISSGGSTRVVASGIQVTAKGLKINWPAVVSTGTPSVITKNAASRTYQPDLRNPSVLYTDVEANGAVTVWIDASNWSQLWPADYQPAPQVSVPVVVAPTPDVSSLRGPNWQDVWRAFQWIGFLLMILIVLALIGFFWNQAYKWIREYHTSAAKKAPAKAPAVVNQAEKSEPKPKDEPPAVVNQAEKKTRKKFKGTFAGEVVA